MIECPYRFSLIIIIVCCHQVISYFCYAIANVVKHHLLQGFSFLFLLEIFKCSLSSQNYHHQPQYLFYYFCIFAVLFHCLLVRSYRYWKVKPWLEKLHQAKSLHFQKNVNLATLLLLSSSINPLLTKSLLLWSHGLSKGRLNVLTLSLLSWVWLCITQLNLWLILMNCLTQSLVFKSKSW